MKKGGNKPAAPVPKMVATIGLVTRTPVITTGYSRYGSKAIEQSYEKVSKMKNEDVRTGNYKCFTNKAKVSTGQMYKDKGSGQVGVKNEFKVSSTVKVGNKHGYTEYYTEERVRDVSYEKGGVYKSGGCSSSNNYRLTYGGYGGYKSGGCNSNNYRLTYGGYGGYKSGSCSSSNNYRLTYGGYGGYKSGGCSNSNNYRLTYGDYGGYKSGGCSSSNNYRLTYGGYKSGGCSSSNNYRLTYGG